MGSGIFGNALGANFAPPTTRKVKYTLYHLHILIYYSIAFLGFSSSLFGIIGFLYIDLIANWAELEQPIRYLILLLLGTALSFILGLLPGVDNFSHMGGLVAGILLSLFLLPPLTPDTKKKKYAVYFVRFISLFLYGLFLGILIHHFSTSNIDEVKNYNFMCICILNLVYRSVHIVDMYLVYQFMVFVIKKNFI